MIDAFADTSLAIFDATAFSMSAHISLLRIDGYPYSSIQRETYYLLNINNCTISYNSFNGASCQAALRNGA